MMSHADTLRRQMVTHSQTGACPFCRRAKLTFLILAGVSVLTLVLLVISDTFGLTSMPPYWTAVALTTTAVTGLLAMKITAWHEATITPEEDDPAAETGDTAADNDHDQDDP